MLVWVQNIVVRWRLFYLYALLIVIISVLPINGPGTAINHIFIVSIRLDYLLHCLVYIPLVLFLWIEKGSDLFLTSGKIFIWIILLLVFAAITEVIQYFLTYRAFNINDMLANILGIIIGFAIVLLYNKFGRYFR
jgi:VanZ family protein